MDTQLELWQVALSVGAPFILAVVEIFHPHPHDLLKIDLPAWLFVHYAQLLLFPLSALALATLVRGQTGIAPMLCRICMFLFGVAYTVFDTAAGLVTGILIKAANLSNNPEAWRPAILTVWTHPIVGGAPAPFLAVFGSVALSVGAVAAAVRFKRSGSSWIPVLLLVMSSFGIAVFKTHAWPGGPLTFGGIAIASAWLLWEKRTAAARRNPQEGSNPLHP